MKKYQEGGTTEYNLWGSGSTFYGENPNLEGTPIQYLIDQIETLGFNINPYGDIGAQLGSITQEDISKGVRSTYDIGKAVKMDPNMFQGFNPMALETLQSDFYNPIMEEGREGAQAQYVQNIRNIKPTGIAASGGRKRKETMAKDIYAKSMDKTFLGIDEQRSKQMAGLLENIAGAHSTGVGLRYG
jgi:hypothetical protein